MKKLLLPLFLVFVIAGTGCSSYIQIGAVENNTKHEFYGSYYKFSGTKEKSLTVKEGESKVVTVDIVTKKGSIDVSIYSDKDHKQYEGMAIATSNFTVTLSEPGTYTIKLDASDHKGSYKFKW